MCWLSQKEAEEFYKVHRQQPFYGQLVDYMSSTSIVALELLAPGELQSTRPIVPT